jgi:hypothetical protein
MIVRIRLKQGPRIVQRRGQRDAAPAEPPAPLRPVAVALLWSSLPPFTLALWKLGCDLGLASGFPLASGILAHWQVWFSAGAALVTAAWFCRRR